MNRDMCYLCKKARVMCYCTELRPFVSQPEFVILIHPKETRKAINTGRMAFRSMKNAHFLEGNDFSDHVGLNALLSDSTRRCFLLFPGESATDLEALPEASEGSARTDVFIVLDATWSMARKMYKLSRNLHAIPQVMFTPTHASEFVIRQQPGEICFSTIETIHHIIERCGQQTGGEHHHLLTLFRSMVQKQIDYEIESDRAKEKPQAVREH